ncbi:methyl-accepting chemotaxis protein [Bdellovibrio bacteriovorus]|uniref:methyl-accepting chemotaxis protein n=1 Tax=Bdellovibrio bacteriovorus TaxID=959 RepID=UPI001E2DC229|nr:methyl-accepting chemotaxis protein [Bdellovibrio bacteriovorus]
MPIALVGTVVLGGIAFLAVQDSFRDAKKAAHSMSEEMGRKYAQQIKSYLDKSFAQAEVVGRHFAMETETHQQDRRKSYQLLREVLKSDSQYLATWSAWEPNAYDGKDAQFANTEYHEKTGRVYPWWVRQGDEIIFKTLLNEETPDLGDWYFQPMQSKQSMLVEPYKDTVNGKELVMTSAVYTVVQNGTAKGLVGIDISLDKIKELVAEIRPFADSQSFLVSDKMMVVAGPHQDEVMQEYKAGAALQALLQKHEIGSIDIDTERGKEFFLVMPVSIYDLSQKWTLVIRTPEKTILASAYASLWRQLGFSLVGLLMLMSVVYFGAKRSEKKISTLSQGLSTSSAGITEDIQHLNSTGGQLAESSTRAAASIEETVASLEEITSMVRLNTGNAQNAAMLSGDSARLAKTGEEKILELVQTMTQIESSSQKIEEIISIIDDIAFQTNLLALNASVEAARAGEHGKGFAVVAEAVRSLAQRSAVAAKDITQLISTSVVQVKQGTVLVRANGDVLKQMSLSIEKVATLNSEIANASQQQSAGIEQINVAINQLDQVIQSNAAEAGEIVNTAAHISEKSEVMNSTVKVLSAA